MRTLAIICVALLLGTVGAAVPLVAQDEQDPTVRDRNKIDTRNSGGPPAAPTGGVERDRNKINTQNSGGPPGARATSATTGQTGLASETEWGAGQDVDVDTGHQAAGAMDVDLNRTTDADTDSSGIDETGGMAADTTGAAGDSDLPDTASTIPLAGLVGSVALLSAFALVFWRRRGRPRSR